ncbi:alpha-amylase family protein [Paenibacillus koleovorans]|uniref:alpha-amylase family protein n=1 Tax=Paenibacillus koleovorans TaxID=121608 RepID=UPI000FDAB68E|nr:alpha-amylase family protein [Paenibacillus koleovorans]
MKPKWLDDFEQGTPQWSGALVKGEGKFPIGVTGATLRGVAETAELGGDWSAYQSLQFMIYNPWGRIAIGGLQLVDKESDASPDRHFGDAVDRGRALLLGEGVTHVIVQIAPIQTQRGDRMLNLEEIAKVVLRMPEPAPGEEPIAVAALRLSTLRSEVDGEALVQPGDSVILLKHLDIYCYTFEPDNYVDPSEVRELKERLERELAGLVRVIEIAEINGKQTHYARAARMTADIALKLRPMLAWHFSPAAKLRNMSDALVEVIKQRTILEQYTTSKKFEDDEDDANVPLSLVRPIPDFKSLRIKGNAYVDTSGSPVLVCSMSYHNDGALMQFFSPEQHKTEIFAVGGGSRYDIEWSPVYEAFHRHEGTKRVGWKGWCGHLIKDQWAMGGRKENVIICLENEHILDAIDQYNKEHAPGWVGMPNLMYVILGYELTYMCYCDTSIARYREWLKDKHEGIERLNERWNTSYASFSEIIPPPTEGFAPLPDVNRAAWVDWTDWNTRRFTDHLIRTKKTIRSYHPTIPICAGGTHSMLSPDNGTTGIDEEMIINEVDDVILHEGNDLLSIDLLRALADTPKPMVDPEQDGDSSRWMLNYLHGKTSISKFWWPKQPSRQFPMSTMNSPAHGEMSMEQVAEMLYTALDIRRLSQEITAFWDMPMEVAILYSKTNMLQVRPELLRADSTPFLTSLRSCYHAARSLDTGITFLSEKQLTAGRASRYKLLVLPAVKYMPEESFAALDRYVREGGHVLVLPESLVADEYCRPQLYLEQWGIRILNTVTPDIAYYGDLEQRYDQNFQRAVHYEEAMEADAVDLASELSAVEVLRYAGVMQEVELLSGEPVARSIEGRILLSRHHVGRGVVWYSAGTPSDDSLMRLLDELYDKSGVHRPLHVTDLEGNRVVGLEARLVRRKHDDLIYVANESGRTVSFRLHTERSCQRIRELRTSREYSAPEGSIKHKETLLFALSEDPSIRIREQSVHVQEK